MKALYSKKTKIFDQTAETVTELQERLAIIGSMG